MLARLIILSCTAQNLFPFNLGGDLMQLFSLPSKHFLFALCFVNFSFLLLEPELARTRYFMAGFTAEALHWGRHLCPLASHFSWGSRISLLLSCAATSAPGISALFTVYAVEEAQGGSERHEGTWISTGISRALRGCCEQRGSESKEIPLG